MAERYAQLVGQQGEELTLLRTAEQEAARARERNEELEGTGTRESVCIFVCVKVGRVLPSNAVADQMSGHP